MKNRRYIEYKKIALAFIVLFSVLFIIAGRIAELFGVIIDSSVDTALVYVILGAYAAYCTASATDKYGMNKYGAFVPDGTANIPQLGIDYEKEDGSE